MIELISKEQMAKAIKRAKQLKPFVRYRGWRWYEVKSTSTDEVYTLHFYKSSGKRYGECNCKGGQRGFVCLHLAAAAAVHVGIAAMRASH